MKKFYTSDIETKKGFVGDFLIGGIFDGKKYLEFTKETNFMRFILGLKGVVFFHYLDFDIRTILDWCSRNKIKIKTMPVMSGDRRVIEWKINDVVFRDSFVLTQSSLRDLAESFNLKTRKLEIRNYQFLKRTKELKRYLRNDVIVLYKILIGFYNFIGWRNFDKKTIASIALDKFKEISKQSYQRIIETSVYEEIDKFLRQAYFSGYYATFKTEIENKNQRILKIDVNSYYASAMCNNVFPWGATMKSENEKEISELITKKLGIIQAKTRIPKGLKFGFLPVKTGEEGVEYPVKGVIRGTWTTPEIIFALNLGYKFKFEKVVFWQFKNHLFRKYINYLAKIKRKSKGAKRTIAKQLLVSLYGKFAQRRDISLFKKLERPIPNRLYLDEDLTISEEKKYIRTPYSHPEISIFTTAYARIWMYQICQKIGWENIFAIINDSLIIRDNLSRKFKEKWFDENEIGKFKVEARIEKGIVFARGVYALKNIDGTEIIRNQGALKEFSKLLTFEDFEKVKKRKQKIWKQYNNLKQPRTIYSYLKGKSKLKEERITKRKIKIKA